MELDQVQPASDIHFPVRATPVARHLMRGLISVSNEGAAENTVSRLDGYFIRLPDKRSREGLAGGRRRYRRDYGIANRPALTVQEASRGIAVLASL